MEVQIFGLKNDADTRKALRFFSERRVRAHFVDFKVRGPAKGELRRFAQKYGAAALLNRSSKRFKTKGLATALYGDERWLEIMMDEPAILRMPLVRYQDRVTVGPAEDEWRRWTEDGKGGKG